jgi:hypothetical protein
MKPPSPGIWLRATDDLGGKPEIRLMGKMAQNHGSRVGRHPAFRPPPLTANPPERIEPALITPTDRRGEINFPTRRAILRTVGMLPLAALPLAADQTSKASPPSNGELTRLLDQRSDLIARRNALDRKWREVWPRLPSWCTPGPKFLDADGNASGPRVGWPEAAQSELIELGDGLLLARSSPADLRGLFNTDLSSGSGGLAETIYLKRSRQLLLRLRAKRTCLQSHGLPRSQDWVPIDTQIEAIELAIAALGGAQFTAV